MQSSTPSNVELSVPESERHSTASGAGMLAQHTDPTVPSATKTRLHLPYLDGIRALMALYVVHNHILGAINSPHLPFGWHRAEFVQMMHHGHYAVAVFIVLSGYCLMLPVLNDNDGLRGGRAAFFKRRARRILPPYYAALFASGILCAISVFVLHDTVPELASRKSWLLHVLLIHNLSASHVYDFDGPLWSIATEWQIYFLFPLLFLPVWKRFGEGALFVVGVVLAAVVTLLFPTIIRGCPWFVALFTFGMIAAKWSLRPAAWMRRIPWAWVGAVFTIATYLAERNIYAFSWYSLASFKGQISWYPLSDFAVGAATCCFLLHGTWATLEGRTSKLLKVLSWRPLVFVGAFSYSLYLIHMPIQNMAPKVISHLGPSLAVQYVGMVVLYIPFVVLLAYGFYQVFEKPFLGASKPRKRDRETASV